MALKFRRGTTAQQSGSLAYGEPYVNTTLGTLLIGGPNGDIVLGTSGTGSTGNFGAISGSGLDITGNANIAGNLTLGGAITIGDATADTVNVIASLSSSLIPSVTNAFDLGSETKIWRDLYISTGSIKFIGAGNAVVSSLNATSLNSNTASINLLNTFTGSALTRFTEIGVVSGSLITSASAAKTTNDSQGVSITNLNLATASLIIETTNLELFSGSANTRFTEIGVVSGSLISSASAAKTTNDSQGVSITNLNLATASLIIETTNLELFSSSANTRFTEIGVVSGSLITSASAAKTTNDSQGVSITNLNLTTASLNTSVTNLNTATSSYETKGRGIVSGSAQIDGSLLGSNKTITIGSTATTLGGTSTTLAGLTSVSSTGFTGALTGNASTATTLATARTINGTSFDGGSNITIPNLVSGSAQITAGSTTNFATDVKTQLNSNTVVSSSVQIDLTATSNYIGGILTRLNAVGVVSGSTQVIGILSSLNTYTGSNNTTNTTQDTRLTALEASASTALSTNNTQGTSITNLNSATASLIIETTNLELFSSSALTRLDNLEGKDFSITLTGDVTGTGTVTNLSNVSFATTVAANSVALGTDTTGNYMSDLTQGTGVTITHTPGEGSNATIAIGQSVATGASPTFAGLTINGAITATGDITAFYTSDKRHKNNIQLIPNALEKVSKLNGVTWEWNDDVHEVTKSTPKTGLIAQEVQEVLPQVVIERQDGFLALDYSKMMGLMVEAIKEQQTQIHSLTIEIEKLKEAKGL